MTGKLKYFKASFYVTIIGLALGAAIGWYYTGTVAGTTSLVFIVAMLAVLETSLSFDNAVVNASVMRDMSQIWRHRFLTWGMAFSVFGMRFFFPLIVVSIVASVGPLEALRLAAFEPVEYARLLTSARVGIGAFGGAFLGMVCLKYFFDEEKEIHWLGPLEKRLAHLGKFEAMGIGLMMVVLYAFSRMVPAESALELMVAGVFGLVTFIAVDAIGAVMEVEPGKQMDVHKAGLAGFLYLNVLDASFSFDGVIGAFALSNNLFIIAIGLGIGAMFVRSLTIMLVDEGTLESYRYLEHGAFYAIGALAVIMLINTYHEVPEVVSGLIGAAFIGVAFWASIRYKHSQKSRDGGPRAAA